MRVLHDGPLHYTSVDAPATALSYLAVSYTKPWLCGMVPIDHTMCSLFLLCESEKSWTAVGMMFQFFFRGRSSLDIRMPMSLHHGQPKPHLE